MPGTGSVRLGRALLRQVLLLACVWSSPAYAQDLTEEVRVKAAYLHKFPGFVEWPPSTAPQGNAPFVIGVAGSDAIYLELERIARGRLVQGRPVEARRVRSATKNVVAGVHVLFLGRELGSEIAAYVRTAEALPLLTVAEQPQALRSVVLNFVDRGGTVRFEVFLQAANAVGLTLSSRLLAVADRVHGVPAGASESRQVER